MGQAEAWVQYSYKDMHADPEETPKFCRARPVPYAMQAKMEQEIDRLVNEGILELVQFADWAVPIVSVLKINGSLLESVEISTHDEPGIKAGEVPNTKD